jgi:hypothetical protein
MSRAERGVLAGVSLLVLIWLPGTLASDVRGLRSDLRLSPAGRADARGPSAAAGTDLPLVRFAQSTIPSGAPYAVVRAGRWRERRLAAAREAGQAWTQFALAPRVQVGGRDAAWLLLFDSSPRAAGVSRPLRTWRFGQDWLVHRR